MNEKKKNSLLFLGIEFGSTRIKAVLINENHEVLAQGNYDWENQLIDGIWTYDLNSIIDGLQICYRTLKRQYEKKYYKVLKVIDGIGISGMMHGYLVFDEKMKLLTPFRTWRNTMCEEASKELTKLFHFPIPQRWSISHLYQAILNNEEHLSSIAHQSTLAGYVHYLLSGKNVLGIGEASGMFPIDFNTKNYNEKMLHTFDELISAYEYPWKIQDLLPKVLSAGEDAGRLTSEGALLLDPEGDLVDGSYMCPPEGDAGTGMIATNSIYPKSGNVSAGTSVFAMVVLEKPLSHVYDTIDIVSTPDGYATAMVHCNNGTSELGAWVTLFSQVLDTMGIECSIDKLYATLFHKALEYEESHDGYLSCNYLSGEHITGFSSGMPLLLRKPDSAVDIGSFMLTQLYSSLSTLKIGMNILLNQEKITLEKMYGHGGFFRTPVVGQKIMSASVQAPVHVLETAGEGGAWGCAILAAYRVMKRKNERLPDYLENKVFNQVKCSIQCADQKLIDGFDHYLQEFQKVLQVERTAVDEFFDN